MDLTYLRRMYRPDGVFSLVSSDDTGAAFGVVLEHAYWDDAQQRYLPILQPGVYDCVRGPHRLDGMTEDFETFEILNVVDQNQKKHSGVLFHWGNWNRDSKGCSLLGEHFAVADDPKDNAPNTPVEMITNSRATFAKFMEMQKGVNRFKLTVRG